MSERQCIEALGNWEGYSVRTVQRFEAGDKGKRPEVWIELIPRRDCSSHCDLCGLRSDSIHDTTERWVRDLAVFDADTWLMVHRRRVKCPQCGPQLERLSWLERYARVTRRLADSVARLCAHLAIKHVADFFGLDWHTVKEIDKAYLNRTLGPVDMSGVELLVMDEFAIQKGHRYATVVVDARNKRVLWVGRGRGREDVRPFFALLGVEGCRQVRAVAMDMTAAYELEVRRWCPQAEIVFDLFHVVAKYGREVIDRVRVDEANRLAKDRNARQVVKGSRWLLLRNRENLERKEERIRLNELLGANRALMTVYVLKEDLKQLWSYRYAGAAMNFWKQWYNRAVRSRIAPLKLFASRLKGYLPGIIAHARWPLHTSLLEGINNKIKVIKRIAYGFRDDDYFFLKVRAAFPGIPR